MVGARTLSVREAAGQAVFALKRRDETICRAHANGASIRTIAAEAGLSPARIHQIIHGR